MIQANFSAYAKYVTDSLYQWDIDQVLKVTGLNLTVAPEVHFSNANMDRAIVKQAELKNHIITVNIPNSLLQEPLRIYAHIGVYEGATFKTVEVVEIPVIARKRPLDYQITDSDEEIYSFKSLENALKNKASNADAEALGKRIDVIVANTNNTEGNSELVDVRVGLEGEAYLSAGDAVRQQLAQTVKGAVSDVYLPEKATGNFFMQTTGAHYALDYGCSVFYELPDDTRAVFISGTDYNQYFPLAVFVNGSGAVTGNSGFLGTEKAYISTREVEIPAGSTGVYVNLFSDHYAYGAKVSHAVYSRDAAVIFNSLFTSAGIPENPEYESVCVGFGDSIMQGVGVLPADGVPMDDALSVLGKILKMNVVNGGIGGTTFAGNYDGSFCHIVDAVVSGDWGKIDAHIRTLIEQYPGQGFDGLSLQFAKIKALDFSEVSAVVVAYGTNDWNFGAALDNESDLSDKKTICGALRYGVSRLLTAYPSLKVYVFTPCYRDGLGTGETSDTYKNATTGLLLSEVGDGIEATCKALHIPCKNMYYSSNLNEYTRDYYLADGTHRNKAGYKLLGTQYAKFISAN